MFVELHILQNFAPSNLNRDDTGAPKECEFGGYRRARISSQAFKRAIRREFKKGQKLAPQNLASRTKRLTEELVKRLEKRGRPLGQAKTVVEAALAGVGLKLDNDGKTQYLLFLGHKEMDAIAELCNSQWDVLVGMPSKGTEADTQKSPKTAKRAGKDAVPQEVRRAIEKVLNGGEAADLALFGRMIADLPDKNIDAASQVAHAISTNRVNMELDYYTAIDDLKPEDTEGADMIGTIGFNSACFYRYANVDTEQLKKNLGGDEDLVRKTIEAFIRASVEAIPAGKQNSMAAQNPPSLIFAVVRERGLWSLSNAFLKPVRPTSDNELVQESVKALSSYWERLVTMYGQQGIISAVVTSLDDSGVKPLESFRVGNVDTLVRKTVSSVTFS